ncbi:hypothetical protein B0H15DRAFT_1005864 [Mycena belliarum]|uniref:Uncharacterized protein n=1 Tax=Mycena belliarum TaxID=1033014 RepID=A0AAD6TS49_9AGAR|nr:hypothetical protein B0H15DRAFT_1005864 [Mycena belliae]
MPDCRRIRSDQVIAHSRATTRPPPLFFKFFVWTRLVRRPRQSLSSGFSCFLSGVTYHTRTVTASPPHRRHGPLGALPSLQYVDSIRRTHTRSRVDSTRRPRPPPAMRSLSPPPSVHALDVEHSAHPFSTSHSRSRYDPQDHPRPSTPHPRLCPRPLALPRLRRPLDSTASAMPFRALPALSPPRNERPRPQTLTRCDSERPRLVLAAQPANRVRVAQCDRTTHDAVYDAGHVAAQQANRAFCALRLLLIRSAHAVRRFRPRCGACAPAAPPPFNAAALSTTPPLRARAESDSEHHRRMSSPPPPRMSSPPSPRIPRPRRLPRPAPASAVRPSSLEPRAARAVPPALPRAGVRARLRASSTASRPAPPCAPDANTAPPSIERDRAALRPHTARRAQCPTAHSGRPTGDQLPRWHLKSSPPPLARSLVTPPPPITPDATSRAAYRLRPARDEAESRARVVPSASHANAGRYASPATSRARRPPARQGQVRAAACLRPKPSERRAPPPSQIAVARRCASCVRRCASCVARPAKSVSAAATLCRARVPLDSRRPRCPLCKVHAVAIPRHAMRKRPASPPAPDVSTAAADPPDSRRRAAARPRFPSYKRARRLPRSPCSSSVRRRWGRGPGRLPGRIRIRSSAEGGGRRRQSPGARGFRRRAAARPRFRFPSYKRGPAHCINARAACRARRAAGRRARVQSGGVEDGGRGACLDAAASVRARRAGGGRRRQSPGARGFERAGPKLRG